MWFICHYIWQGCFEKFSHNTLISLRTNTKISTKPKIHIDFWDYNPKKYIDFWDYTAITSLTLRGCRDTTALQPLACRAVTSWQPLADVLNYSALLTKRTDRPSLRPSILTSR